MSRRLTKAQNECLVALRSGLFIRVRPAWYTALYSPGDDADRRIRRVSDLTVRALYRRGYLDRYYAGNGVEEYSLKTALTETNPK